MSRLDTSGMRSLWYRIGDIFARKAHAVGSLSLVVTTLNWLNIDGSALGNINLGNTFATRSQAGHSLSIANRTITLHSVDNTNLGSVTVPDTDTSGKADDSYVKHHVVGSLDISFPQANTLRFICYSPAGDVLSTQDVIIS